MDKLLSMIGLCKKAGRLLEGYEVVVTSVQLGETPLVLTTEDLSQRSLRKLQNAMQTSTAKHLEIPIPMEQIKARIGRRVGILGVADQGFATAIEDIVTVEKGGFSIDDGKVPRP